MTTPVLAPAWGGLEKASVSTNRRTSETILKLISLYNPYRDI